MPFDDPTRNPDQAPTTRRQREDRAILFACPLCMRQRVNPWAIAFEPDTFVVCAQGSLHNCPWCEDACIVAHVAPLRVAGER